MQGRGQAAAEGSSDCLPGKHSSCYCQHAAFLNLLQEAPTVGECLGGCIKKAFWILHELLDVF